MGAGVSHSHCLAEKDMQTCFLFLRSVVLLNAGEGKVRQSSASSKVIPHSAKNRVH